MLLSSLLGCSRAPGSEICPRIEPGDLVISELRRGEDDVGQYVEIYNASGRTVDLQGVWIRQHADNGKEHALVIRESLDVPAGDYVVIGPGLDKPKAWVDYAVGWDIPGGDPAPEEGEGDTGEPQGEIQQPTVLFRFETGALELESCDESIDVAEVLHMIPAEGSLACGNAELPPDAADNDQAGAGCWCVDADPPEPGSPFPGIGRPGTPGSANRCP